jgi:hypothetical protein
MEIAAKKIGAPEKKKFLSKFFQKKLKFVTAMARPNKSFDGRKRLFTLAILH